MTPTSVRRESIKQESNLEEIAKVRQRKSLHYLKTNVARFVSSWSSCGGKKKTDRKPNCVSGRPESLRSSSQKTSMIEQYK